VAAAFDHVFENVVYVNDPAGRDYWASPNETLQKMTGDCEDHAILLSALITAMGGNARFHMEKDHAFLSVYVGVDMDAVHVALEKYYNTPLEVASFHDRSGYWLAADSTASMYLGGLPLGGQPLDQGWGLTNTTFHYVVDMIAD
jgi:transglutaminase-like putative cysteine protease